MIRICPRPIIWETVYQKLVKFSKANGLEVPACPLVMSLWHLSDDFDKENLWKYHKKWAVDNNCQELLEGIPDKEYYFVYQKHKSIPRLFPYDNGKSKVKPSAHDLKKYLEILTENWESIIGSDTMKSVIKPLYFSGKKDRCLWVLADAKSVPPWGKWGFFNEVGEYGRYPFTQFRYAICQAISPHAVDHVNFINKEGEWIGESGYKFNCLIKESLERMRTHKKG